MQRDPDMSRDRGWLGSHYCFSCIFRHVPLGWHEVVRVFWRLEAIWRKPQLWLHLTEMRGLFRLHSQYNTVYDINLTFAGGDFSVKKIMEKKINGRDVTGDVICYESKKHRCLFWLNYTNLYALFWSSAVFLGFRWRFRRNSVLNIMNMLVNCRSPERRNCYFLWTITRYFARGCHANVHHHSWPFWCVFFWSSKKKIFSLTLTVETMEYLAFEKRKK